MAKCIEYGDEWVQEDYKTALVVVGCGPISLYPVRIYRKDSDRRGRKIFPIHRGIQLKIGHKIYCNEQAVIPSPNRKPISLGTKDKAVALV